MISLSIRDIKQGYKGMKRLAQKAFAEGDYETSFRYVEKCTTIAQQFNWIYADDELEDLLCEIGQTIIPGASTSCCSNLDRVVLYDDFCTSFVLALQYLDALVGMGKEILYITSKDVNANLKFSHIIGIVQSRPKVKIHIVPQGNTTERSIDIYNSIVGFCPGQVLLHIKAFSDALPSLYRLPKSIKRYIINLADQTFWLGKKAIDYVLEFRQFGVSVSQQRRGIKPEQQLLVPFYPIVDGNDFEGFPKECASNKVIVFSGGDFYKVLDKKKTYWKLVKHLLDTYPQIVFLFATKITGTSTDLIDRFITDNGFQGRFIYIGFRKDINEVFKHCDIYMGTCPASGSLMSQLAAVNAKPILQYYYPGTPDDETEQAICYHDKFSISFQNEDAFMEEAHRLISDGEYRKKQGERLKNAMITPEQFDKLVSDTLSTNVSQIPLEPFDVNYPLLDDRWFALEKVGYIDTLPYLWGIIGKKRILRFMPMIFIKKYLDIIIKNFL